MGSRMGDTPGRRVEGTRRFSRTALRIRETRLARGMPRGTRPCYLRLFGFLAFMLYLRLRTEDCDKGAFHTLRYRKCLHIFARILQLIRKFMSDLHVCKMLKN